MLKFNRSKKRLVIPVGINPSYGIDSSTLYNVSDADVEANDVLEGKIAYGKDGKIVGTLDVESEKEESYQAGVEEQKAKLESITITENGSYSREDGYNEVIVDVPDLNGDYNEGYTDGYNNGYTIGNTDGIVTGRNQIIEEQSDANITASDVLEGKIGYGANNEKIVGTVDLNGEKEISYQDGYETGKSNGIEIGKDEIIDGMSDATITPQNLPSGLIGYSVNNTRVVGEANVVSSIDLAATGIKFGYSTFTEIPSYYDFSNVTNMSQMFYRCLNITTVPLFDTSNVTNMYYMFSSCSNLTTVPQFDTSNVTNMSYMFQDCSNLITVPLFDTSKVTNMSYMFQRCSNLTSVPLFDTSNVTTMRDMFYGCSNLTSVPEFDLSGMTGNDYNCTQIFGASNYVIDFGGFKDLGKAYQNSGNSYRDVLLQSQAKLSYQSCMNVINKVYDLTLKPDYTNKPKIRFHATPYALLSADDIAIATAKGWTVQAG